MGQKNSRTSKLYEKRSSSRVKNFEKNETKKGNNELIKITAKDDDYVITSADLGRDLLDKFSENFGADPKNKLASNAISGNDMTKVLLNRSITIDNIHVFSEKIELEGKATNQRSSGRCWLFAATNVLRLIVMKKYKLKDFELSQSYLFFYDKLEKSNFFLENMIKLSDLEIDDRLIQYMVHEPVNDGGQWDMVVNLLEKYGVVPKSVYTESFNSSNTSKLNWLVITKLQEFAHKLRKLHSAGNSISVLRTAKAKMMEEIYRILAISLGEPPKEVEAQKATETLSLVNDPRNEYFKLYTVEYLGNIQGGFPVRYVNIPIGEMKNLAIQALRSGKPVWFGADFHLTKAQRLQYGQSSMTHAMVFTGVHLENGESIRWRVENSWGEDLGEKGYFVMNDDWFSEWVYQIVLEKKDVPKEYVAILDQKPNVLSAWDPMGSLAI
ncbi:3697_t:CDS:10 [Diversispora eburnea]|uniref:Cysteine proteinase 1, mitochondrial n=1 Tax=Diversispora eburnea TaxID=1213867 RepID=A0A9N8W5W1_9GLOM|nr:3697_t:CDS:10 [Diversispora eburnea]